MFSWLLRCPCPAECGITVHVNGPHRVLMTSYGEYACEGGTPGMIKQAKDSPVTIHVKRRSLDVRAIFVNHVNFDECIVIGMLPLIPVTVRDHIIC